MHAGRSGRIGTRIVGLDGEQGTWTDDEFGKVSSRFSAIGIAFVCGVDCMSVPLNLEDSQRVGPLQCSGSGG